MAKTLHYDFLNNPSLTDHTRGTATPDLSITRATTATMVDADGYIREVQSGEARFTGATFGENALTHAEQIDNAAWIKTRAVVTANATTAPDGTLTADRLTDDNLGGVNSCSAIQAKTFKVGHTYTFSFYAKADQVDIVHCGFLNITTPDNVWFNLTTGTVGTVNGTDVEDTSIEDVGDGWYRCSVTHYMSGPDVAGHVGFFPCTTDGVITVTRDGTNSIYVWGAQVEEVSGAWDSENLLLQSEDFSTTWLNWESSETANQGVAPDGATTADGFNENGNLNTHFIYQLVTLSDSTNYTFSVFVKASNRSWVALQQVMKDANYLTYFDLSTGAVGTDGSGASGIEDYGNGWYRVWIRNGSGTGATAPQARIYSATGDGGSFYQGASQEALLLWGAQLERRKPTQSGPGTYTATTTAAVTNYSPSTYVPTTTAAVSSLTGTSTQGLLVEEARTNICLQSEDFSTSWTNLNSVDNSNQTTAPDGSTTADQLIDDSATGSAQVRIFQTVTVATSTAYTFSCFLKADQLSWGYLELTNFTTPAASQVWFDLSTGAVGTTDAGFDSAGIEDYGNGWYRCWGVFTTDGTDTTGNIVVGVAEADGNVNATRDGTSSIFVWGAQLEAGTFPTSYIPTTTTSVTRNADAITTTDVSWYASDDTGTLYTRAAPIASVGGSQDVVALCNGTFQESHYHYFSSTAAVANSRDGNVNQYTIASSAGEVAVDTFTRMVSAWAVNDAAAAINGSLEGTDTSVSLPTITELSLGADIPGFSGTARHCHIAEIAYFNERLPNATLEDYSLNGLPTAFPGTVAGDGGVIWMPRSNDPRWAQIITDSGITPSGNFIDDVHAALEALTSTTGSMDDLWKKFKALYNVTDTSEPFSY